MKTINSSALNFLLFFFLTLAPAVLADFWIFNRNGTDCSGPRKKICFVVPEYAFVNATGSVPPTCDDIAAAHWLPYTADVSTAQGVRCDNCQYPKDVAVPQVIEWNNEMGHFSETLPFYMSRPFSSPLFPYLSRRPWHNRSLT